MRILITGGAGFVGSHIADALIEDGDHVSIIDNLSSGSLNNLNPKANFYQLDVKHCEELIANDDFDVVIHCAAQTDVRVSLNDPITDMNENIRNSLILMETMVKFKPTRLVFLSTGGALYDNEGQETPYTERDTPKPRSPYGISKWTVEQYIRFYARYKSLRASILRLANVYGPRNDKGVIQVFKDKIDKGEPITIYGGEQTRDFVHVSDVVSAVKMSINFTLRENVYPSAFNVGTGIPTSLNTLAELMGAKDIRFEPIIPGEIMYSALNPSALKHQGWEPKISLEEGLALL